MRIIIIGTLYVIFMLLRCPQWLASADTPYLVRAMTYSFFHANILHLVVNSLSLWVVWSGKDRRRDFRNFLTAFVIAVLVFPLGRPCVGISNMLFAACGLRLGARWLRTANGVFFLVLMVAMCFLPQFAGTQHLAAFFVGILFKAVDGCFDSLRRDVSRYTGNR